MRRTWDRSRSHRHSLWLLLVCALITLVGLVAAPSVATAGSPAPAASMLPAQPPPGGDPGDRAAAAGRIRAAWEGRGRPTRMAIVRPTRVDVVADGHLTQQVPLRPGPVTLPVLDRSLPPTWLRESADTALLAATVVLTPGTAMDISGDVSGIRTLALVSARGRLDATDTTITDLGTPDPDSDIGDGGRAAVAFNADSSGALVRTTLARNSTGLELSRSDAVRLDQVTVSDSVGDGIVLRGDRATMMTGIRAERNGGNGMVVAAETASRPGGGPASRLTAGSAGRLITQVSTTGNGRFGLVLIGQTGAQVTDVSTAADR
jgi:hypothetical protein